jgi:hypothetical protein
VSEAPGRPPGHRLVRLAEFLDDVGDLPAHRDVDGPRAGLQGIEHLAEALGYLCGVEIAGLDLVEQVLEVFRGIGVGAFRAGDSSRGWSNRGCTPPR